MNELIKYYTSVKKGNFYENKAEEFLRIKGYKILERNFRSRIGEIDIIAKDGNVLSFIEVKARNNKALVSGKESVDIRKINKLRKMALIYAGKNIDRFFRFDVLAITQGNYWRQYDLIKDAFQMD